MLEEIHGKFMMGDMDFQGAEHAPMLQHCCLRPWQTRHAFSERAGWCHRFDTDDDGQKHVLEQTRHGDDAIAHLLGRDGMRQPLRYLWCGYGDRPGCTGLRGYGDSRVGHESLVNSGASAYYPRVNANRFVNGLCGKGIKDEDIICGLCRTSEQVFKGVDVLLKLSAEGVDVHSVFSASNAIASGVFKASVDDMVLVASKFPAAEPFEKEELCVMHNLERIYANDGHQANPVLATRLRQDGASTWVQSLAMNISCDDYDARKPPRPRNKATFDYRTRLWSQVGLDYMALTLTAQLPGRGSS